MFEYKDLKKIISLVVIAAFIFNIQMISLHSQEMDEWEEEFTTAKQAYIEGKYSETKQRIERIIQLNPDRKDLSGKCYLLLGAVYERQGDSRKAEANYRKAKNEYGIESIDGIHLENLEIYRKVVKGEERSPETTKPLIIEKPKEEPVAAKKKFPVLLVAAGVAVIAVLIYFLTKKAKEKQYTLTVNQGEGIEGTPAAGTGTYKQGTTINYNYTLKPGYNNLVVQLDGASVSSSGTITMNQNHTLTASAGTNVVTFVTSQDTVQVPEGGTATFYVRLSAQPTTDVNATVTRESGDTDITVISDVSLTFTTTNWNTYKAVTLQAAQDPDTTNGQASISIHAPGTGIPQKNIIAIEQDDDEEKVVTVSITNPKNGQTITGTVTIEARATSGNGIDRVDFYVSNKSGTDSNEPYQFVWDTSVELEGKYTILVKAYDKKGNTGEATITVIVEESISGSFSQRGVGDPNLRKNRQGGKD